MRVLRIGQSAIWLDSGFGRQTRLLHVTKPQNVEHLLARGHQIVRNDPAMASPPEALRAHDGRARRVTKRAQFLNA
jgi:hypothetical protein